MILSEAILATLAYHDIFEYPLTVDEIHQYLISRLVSKKKLIGNLLVLVNLGKIGKKDGYYYLRNKSVLVATRRRRRGHSEAKLKRAKLFANILKLIPTLKLVGISGALAMHNSSQNDDIDLVLMTSKGTLWTSRFLANLLLSPFKRNPYGQKVADKACLNVFIDEKKLRISPPGLYLAHEVCQMKPLWDRDNIYQKFIKANSWVKEFLPSWKPKEMVNGKYQSVFLMNQKGKMVNRKSKKQVHSLFTINYSLIENFLRSFQLWYMRGKITTEKIGAHQLFFHPASTGEWVMGEYKKRLKKLNLTMEHLIV